MAAVFFFPFRFLCTTGKGKRWSSACVMMLLDMMEGRMADLDNPFFPNKDIYIDIAKCLQGKGFPFSTKDVEYKWGNMMKQYKGDLAKKEKSGSTFQRTDVFDKMQTMLAHRHDIKPLHTVGSGLKRKPNVDEDKKDEDVKKPRMSSPSTDLKKKLLEKIDSTLSYFKESDAKREAAQKKREENEERKLALLERLVENTTKK